MADNILVEPKNKKLCKIFGSICRLTYVVEGAVSYQIVMISACSAKLLVSLRYDCIKRHIKDVSDNFLQFCVLEMFSK